MEQVYNIVLHVKTSIGLGDGVKLIHYAGLFPWNTVYYPDTIQVSNMNRYVLWLRRLNFCHRQHAQNEEEESVQ